MKKFTWIIIILVIGILIGWSYNFFLQRTADEKINGEWKYYYNDHQTLSLISDKTGMYLGDKDTPIYPLKNSTNNPSQDFDFLLLDNKNNNKYVFHVKIDDRKNIMIEPKSDGNHSLQEVIYGTDSLSEKAKNETVIKLKKSE